MNKTMIYINIEKIMISKIIKSSLILLLLTGCKKDDKPRDVIIESEISNDIGSTDISFANGEVGYISTGYNVKLNAAAVFKTTDGGTSWNALPVIVDTIPSSIVRSVYALNPDTVYATYTCYTENCGVCKSVDGGITWKRIGNFDLLAVGYSNIYFINSKIGFVCRNNEILKTTDGGNNWVTKFNYSGFGGIGQLSFTSDKIGYASQGFVNDYASSGTLLKTTDGGDTWTQISSLTEYVTCLKFVTDNTGYAFTYNNNIYKTSNGEQDWILLKNLEGGAYFSSIVSGNIKYFATVNKIYKSTDDFKSFVEIYSSHINNTNFSIKAIQISNHTIFFLSNNSILRITHD
jgi:hypothetical protein